MDLHLIPNAEPTLAERVAIDAVLGSPAATWDGASDRMAVDLRLSQGGAGQRSRRHQLLPALHAAQAAAGYLTPGALNYICRRLDVAPADAYGVASFYALLATEPRPANAVHVCDDIACRVNGAGLLCAGLELRLGPAGAAPEGSDTTWLRSPCLGMCEQAPAALVQRSGPAPDEQLLGRATAEDVMAALDGALAEPAAAVTVAPQTAGDRTALRLLRRVGLVDPTSLDDYRAHDGYQALRQAFKLGPEGVIREVNDARLAGRGGAAFPTGRKWDAVARNPLRPHYLVCNADESEPGTFKDRVLLEHDPFALIEAMTIAGYAIGAERGYLYIRGEYPLAIVRAQSAIDQARARGLLGDDVMGEGCRFEIEVRRGAGAYICGEETALFNSIEGFRGEPRNKPPFPTDAGLFGKPTVVNNVETLANVPDIILHGGLAYAALGVEGATGTKLFCVSGCVERPGVYEAPFGVTLRQVLDLAGGVRGGRSLRAVLLGGGAGSFVTPDDLDVPLTLAGTRAIGASLGSGVVMLFDDTADLTDTVLRIAAFFRDESCGQCVPCRVGTQRQEEALHRLVLGQPLGSRATELALLSDISQAMGDASICGLGQTAASAVQSAIRKLGLFAEGTHA